MFVIQTPTKSRRRIKKGIGFYLTFSAGNWRLSYFGRQQRKPPFADSVPALKTTCSSLEKLEYNNNNNNIHTIFFFKINKNVKEREREGGNETHRLKKRSAGIMVGGWEKWKWKWKWETELELESAFSLDSRPSLCGSAFQNLLSFAFASPVNHFLCVQCVCSFFLFFFLKKVKKMGGLGKTICKIAVYCRIFFFSQLSVQIL